MSEIIAPLPAIEDVVPRSAEDDACLEEIREVLERHGRLRRFGVCLLHQHFPVADDELLVESTDIETRTSIFQPVKRSKVGSDMLETAWRLDMGAPTGDIRPTQHCVQGCKREYNPNTGKDEHVVTHKYGE